VALDPFGLSPDEAIAWFTSKGYRISFDWRDVWKQEHARAFTVAKATQKDILDDIRAAVTRALKNGETLANFRKELRPTLQEKGWWGEKEQVDPVTGETKLVQLGSARRLRVIYETNLRQAQAAGRWERIERQKERRPYARYVCLLDGNERPAHRAWHGTILPVDHPWWDTHAPPNGWGCRCSMQQLSDRDLQRFGYSVSDAAPPSRNRAWVNERTGKRILVPEGIDPGFDYNPGKARPLP
jgi:SPP1 gp7 family putative phage head morphogenesis protein